MNWTEIPPPKFIYRGQAITRRKVIFKTLFGNFEVFEAISGKCYYRHPFIANSYILNEFDNGLSEWFGAPKLSCKNMEEGINIWWLFFFV